MTSRPEIAHVLLSLIDAAFGRARSKLGAEVIGHPKRFAAVDRLDAITNAIKAGGGEVPYLSQLELTFQDGPPEEMRIIIELLEAIQALADWQINRPTGVDDYAVREFFLRVGVTSPWKAPAEIVFRDGNVSPAAQRAIRSLGRFETSKYGGQMMVITPLIGGLTAIIQAVSVTGQAETGPCPPRIRFDTARQIWDVV